MKRVLTNEKSRSRLLQNLPTFVFGKLLEEQDVRGAAPEDFVRRSEATTRNGSMNALVVTPNTKVSIDTIVQ